MANDFWTIVLRIFGAVVIGAVIGLERSYHGRPAGFRTHALVCMSSSLLMLVTVFQSDWMTELTADSIRTDPTRMAQGIMTGIGFLGAGVIFKDGLSVRGLTTAASIWVTASIGILVGVGFWLPAVVGVVATLLVLSGLMAIEGRIPSKYYARFRVRFKREQVMDEEELRRVVGGHGFEMSALHRRLVDAGRQFEYETLIVSRDQNSAGRLSSDLRAHDHVLEFDISPTGD